MPFSFCSMTWVTVSCTVWAEAPGYVALMAICGGAMGGYWETGSFLIAKRPTSITMMAMTQAKMGLFMKNRGMEWLLKKSLLRHIGHIGPIRPIISSRAAPLLL